MIFKVVTMLNAEHYALTKRNGKEVSGADETKGIMFAQESKLQS